MQTTINLLDHNWPKAPKQEPTIAWPRYMKNVETRDHLAGKKLSFSVFNLELEKLRVVWHQVQHTRQRGAVYDFLEAVYGVVSKFNRVGGGEKLLKKLHRHDRKLKRIQDPYSAVIHFVTDHSVDGRTRSKWSRIMRRAEREKKRAELLEDFIRSRGGINECAARCRQCKTR
jgi:hypothetical protein